MKKEFVSSVYIVDKDQILMIFHEKLQKWLPPGGHVEQDETPSEAARREVLEETGLEIQFCKQENLELNYWNAASIERPYLCLLENIPAYKEVPPHQHIDFIYVATPLTREVVSPHVFRWFSWEDFQTLEAEKDIFQETLDVIKHLFTFFSSIQPPSRL